MEKRNSILFYILSLMVIISIIMPIDYKIHNVSLLDALLAVVMLICFVSVVINRENRSRFMENINDFFHSGLDILLILLTLIMFVSVGHAIEKGLSLSESIRFASYILLFFIAKYNVNRENIIKGFIDVLTFSIFLVCLFGIVQFFTGIGLSKDFIEQYSFGAKMRIAANFGNPNTFGAFLILFLFPILLMTIECKNKIKKLYYGIVSLLVLLNIILTFSRNAWLAIGIGAILLAVYYSFKALVAFGVLGAGSLFIPTILRRVKDFTDPSQNVSRFQHWAVAMHMIKDHLLIGVGNGNYVSNYDAYIAKYPQLDFAHMKRFPSHNSYLKVFSELGIIGIVPFLLIMIFSVRVVRKAVGLIEERELKAFFNGFFIAMISFIVMNFFDNLFFVPKITIWFWFLLAIAEGVNYRAKSKESIF